MPVDAAFRSWRCYQHRHGPSRVQHNKCRNVWQWKLHCDPTAYLSGAPFSVMQCDVLVARTCGATHESVECERGKCGIGAAFDPDIPITQEC
jgi:hypothetical protein